MFIESLDELPESLRSQFVEHEFEGKKGYQPKSVVTLENTMRNVKTEKTELKARLDELEGKYGEFEAAKAAEIEAAKAEAMEKARSEGDVTAIEERYQQQMADLEKRKGDEVQTLQAQLQELKDGIISEKRSAFLSDFVTDFAIKGGERAMKMLLANRVEIDPSTNKRVFLDENGSATSLDENGFKAELEKDPTFAPLIRSGIVTTGGGNANGSGGSAGQNRKFNEYSSSELVALKRQDPSTYERLRSEFHGK